MRHANLLSAASQPRSASGGCGILRDPPANLRCRFRAPTPLRVVSRLLRAHELRVADDRLQNGWELLGYSAALPRATRSYSYP